VSLSISNSVRRAGQPILGIVLMIALLGVPFWVIIATAGKTTQEAQRPNITPPTDWGQLFTNFGTVIVDGEMLSALFGTLLIVVPSVIAVLFLGSTASWVLARRKGKAMSGLYAIAISGLVLPPAVVTIVLLLQVLGIDGTTIGMIGVYVGMYLSTAIFFITGFIRTIPTELEEAARVDGASPARVFFQVILPLLGPTIATATILITLFIWNDVFYALFVIGGRLDTLPLNLCRAVPQ
jgi:raffinose/stachyose/melibiose transport system permease protein